MAYATKYRLEIADIHGIIWKVDIQKDNFAGDIITLTGSGSPIEFEFYGEDDIFTQNILGSKATIEVVCQTDYAYSELFTSNNLEYKVLIYHGVTLYWTGYLLVNNYNEPYACPPYYLKLTATDGLGLLKDFRFDGLGYTGREKASKIIYDILSKVNITSFTEYVNLFGVTMTANVNTSPFDQFGIDTDIFVPDTCYDALEKILSLLNAGIRQDQGVFTIYRFRELLHTTMYGRTFTSATDKSSVTKVPAQLINRNGSSSFEEVGGNRSQIAQLKTLYLNYDMGFKESCLEKYDFKANDFVYSGGAWGISPWTNSLGPAIFPLSTEIPAEDKGVYLYANAGLFTLASIAQTIPGVKSQDYKFSLSLEYRFNSAANHTAPQIDVVIVISDGINTKYWTGSAWSDNSSFVSLAYNSDLNAGWTEWETVTKVIDSIPIDGDMTVILSPAKSGTSNVNVAYRNVKLCIPSSSGINDLGIGYTVTAATYGQEIEKEYTLGDGYSTLVPVENQLINYQGIINGYVNSVVSNPGTAWNTYTAGSVDGQADPIIELIGGELGGQYERPRDLLDIDLYETSANAHLKIIGNLQDTMNQYNGSNRMFGISRGTFDVKFRKWSLSLCEIL
ncbi:MAG TPA: hypothetical protein VK213_05960 [Bacteroidales bacterium]|nr:hypothetical protein [Bacteroidales bacterium]